MLLLNEKFNFYVTIITVFEFTRRAVENLSACHAWHAGRRLPTPVLDFKMLNATQILAQQKVFFLPRFK
jgi:hypothetical protein